MTSHDDETARASDPVGAMLRVLDLASSNARTSEDIFTGTSHPMPGGRIFGGQVLGQAIIAATRTTDPDRMPHSMHGYFLRAGDATRDVTIGVERIHDGRSFSTRRSQVYQDGLPIFSMISSFQVSGPGMEHADPFPDGIPQPEDVPDSDRYGGTAGDERPRLFRERPVELRHMPSPIYLAVEGEPTAHQAVWMRTRRQIPNDPMLHRAVLAYLSDLTIQEPVLRAHGVPWLHPGLKVASLDHAMWWHRPARVDDWLLYAQSSPSASGGRGLSFGRIFTREGVLVASVAQEIMARTPEDR